MYVLDMWLTHLSKNSIIHTYKNKLSFLKDNILGMNQYRNRIKILYEEEKLKKMKKVTIDGNEAAAYVSYAFTEVAAIYPITPSSPMAEYIDQWSVNGMKNIFGNKVKLVQMQSEAGAIATVHGAMESGVLTSTYTSSQGLLLMIPTMYRIAGHLKPGVIHVASRAVALHAYSIFAEHSDVMACRQTGYAILASSSVQDVMILGAVAHLASIKGSIPFLHFFDGFRTSHEIQKIDAIDFADLANLLDYAALEKFRKKALNPENPVVRVSGQTPETYFQSREACNTYYDALPFIVEEYMNKLNILTGHEYKLFNYYGSKNAETVLIAMGSVSGTIRETVDYLNSHGENVGFLEVHLYRPFSLPHFLQSIPKTVKTIVVLDRTKENGALGDPLYTDVCAAIMESDISPKILTGRYGLGGKDTNPSQITSILTNAKSEKPVNHFTVGIIDDLKYRSLPEENKLDTVPEGTINCKFWGLSSDGTVSANKNSIKIIGDYTNMYVQAYFEYEGKKSGGVTKSHLRFGTKPILSSYYIRHADFVACHKSSYMNKYDMHSELKPGGCFLLNCSWKGKEIENNLPESFKKYIALNKIRFYIIDATEIAKQLGMGSHTNTILQAAFFKITGIIPIDEAVKYMKNFVKKTYISKGDKIIEKNYSAIDKGVEMVKEFLVPAAWSRISSCVFESTNASISEFVQNILIPVVKQRGNDIPVSRFQTTPDGSMPMGTSKYERRGIAIDVPEWDLRTCIQCNQCSFVCPHAAIRPFLLTKDEILNSPEGLKAIPAIGKDMSKYFFLIQVDPLDCVGCGSCVDTCPSKPKALKMLPLETQKKEMGNWEYVINLKQKNPLGVGSVKGSQFEKPLLEFPGACPGCGETPYVKLITQLFGDRMYIATATGCSLVWATDYPISPYTTNDIGYGPSMSNSLFENNAEFGFGMALGVSYLRRTMKESTEQLIKITKNKHLIAAAKFWISSFFDGKQSPIASINFKNELEKARAFAEDDLKLIDFLLKNAEHLTKKSIWVIGGDGWAYDIGYGGLDHVLSMGEDINVLILDTEIYSNTGGQASKATPKGAVAKFAASGRKFKKKDLGLIAMCYEDVYVAQVAMGANQAHLLKTLKEAEGYPGTSVIIAYAPCQSHGLKFGMHTVQREMKRAVDAGYWHLYRHNPLLKKEGKNPFILDSKKPTGDLKKFLQGETRFTSLEKMFPAEAKRFIKEIEIEAKEKYNKYRKMAEAVD